MDALEVMVKKPQPKPTHAELSETLEKHIFYEAIRFIAQYKLLRAPETAANWTPRWRKQLMTR